MFHEDNSVVSFEVWYESLQSRIFLMTNQMIRIPWCFQSTMAQGGQGVGNQFLSVITTAFFQLTYPCN